MTANNADVSPNLDIELQLLNSGGGTIATANPPFGGRPQHGQRHGRCHLDERGRPAPTTRGSTASARGSTSTSYNDYGSLGAYTLQVTGCGLPSVTAPSAPQNLGGVYQGGGVVDLSWNAPASNGGGAITQYNVYADGSLLGNAPGSSAHITGVPSAEIDFAVEAVNSAGPGPRAHVTVDATESDPEAVPGKAQIGQAKQGARGGAKTATVSWLPPAGATNPPIDGFEFIAYKQNRRGKYVRVFSMEFDEVFSVVKYTTPQSGRHKFAVRAHNDLGYGPLSAKSNAVRPR